MGVLLQALIAARYVDRNAVPASQRPAYVQGVTDTYGATSKTIRPAIESIARETGLVTIKARTRAAK